MKNNVLESYKEIVTEVLRRITKMLRLFKTNENYYENFKKKLLKKNFPF